MRRTSDLSQIVTPEAERSRSIVAGTFERSTWGSLERGDDATLRRSFYRSRCRRGFHRLVHGQRPHWNPSEKRGSPGRGTNQRRPRHVHDAQQSHIARQHRVWRGLPDANSVLGKLANLQKQLDKGDDAGAQSQAKNIVSFIQQKAAQGGLPGTSAQIQTLIAGVLCYAGISPDTFLVFPTDAPQVLLNSTGKAGVSLQGNTVNVPTLITIRCCRRIRLR